MSDMETPLRSGLQKIPVECRTCGVSESFYSNLSVDKFKVRHSGHDVVSGNPRVGKPGRPGDQDVISVNEAVPTPAVPEVTHAPKARRDVSSEAGIKIAKVMVDVLNFASLGSPMVRVRGFDAALEEAFTATLLLEEGAKIKQMFETGNYLDRDASGLLYVWEPDVVEYVDDAKAKLETLGDGQTRPRERNPFPSRTRAGSSTRPPSPARRGRDGRRSQRSRSPASSRSVR